MQNFKMQYKMAKQSWIAALGMKMAWYVLRFAWNGVDNEQILFHQKGQLATEIGWLVLISLQNL